MTTFLLSPDDLLRELGGGAVLPQRADPAPLHRPHRGYQGDNDLLMTF